MNNLDTEAKRIADYAVNALAHKDAIEQLLQAQVYATLALVEAQREATDWGKKQILAARKDQNDFIAKVHQALEAEK